MTDEFFYSGISNPFFESLLSALSIGQQIEGQFLNSFMAFEILTISEKPSFDRNTKVKSWLFFVLGNVLIGNDSKRLKSIELSKE